MDATSMTLLTKQVQNVSWSREWLNFDFERFFKHRENDPTDFWSVRYTCERLYAKVY